MQITEILSKCTIDGNNVKLPQGQLDRHVYLEVKNALELVGGKWKGGKTQAFAFNEDPSDYISQLCQGDKINLKKEFQFFATPDDLADRLVELADIHQPGHMVLEPSAGQGAIIKAIHKQYPSDPVYCYELMPLNRTFLEKIEAVEIIGDDFLNPDGSHPAQDWLYDRIVANPPFSKNQDIEHVYKMYNCLNSTGRLVAVMSNHWRYASGKKETQFREFAHQTDAEIYEIEEGAFKASGTSIAACIIVVDKDPNINTPSFKRLMSKRMSSQASENGCRHSSEPEDKPKSKVLSKPDESIKQFEASFNSFAYRFGQAEVFIDFLDYALLVMKWWEKERDFSYFENKYGDLYAKFPDMLELLSIASDNIGEGFRDGLGDLFMELVSRGKNGQYFTPDNVCEMMSRITIPEIEDGKTVLDPTCGSGRMLLAAAKRNRNIYVFGNDVDITCCKMATLNLLLNSLQGEIALMDGLTMDYQKSWEVSYRNIQGANLPVYRVIENKEDSTLWKLHINSFKANQEKRASASMPPMPEPPKKLNQANQIKINTQLTLF